MALALDAGRGRAVPRAGGPPARRRVGRRAARRRGGPSGRATATARGARLSRALWAVRLAAVPYGLSSERVSAPSMDEYRATIAALEAVLRPRARPLRAGPARGRHADRPRDRVRGGDRGGAARPVPHGDAPGGAGPAGRRRAGAHRPAAVARRDRAGLGDGLGALVDVAGPERADRVEDLVVHVRAGRASASRPSPRPAAACRSCSRTAACGSRRSARRAAPRAWRRRPSACPSCTGRRSGRARACGRACRGSASCPARRRRRRTSRGSGCPRSAGSSCSPRP